jgi:hypothetical protein
VRCLWFTPYRDKLNLEITELAALLAIVEAAIKCSNEHPPPTGGKACEPRKKLHDYDRTDAVSVTIHTRSAFMECAGLAVAN